MSNDFVSYDEFVQDDKFPHKSSRKVLQDQQSLSPSVESVQAGLGISIDNTDPLNPIINGIPYVLPQATSVTLGGIRLGNGLTFNPSTNQVDAAGGDGGDVVNNYQAYLTEDVTASVTVGGISAGEVLSINTLFTEFVKRLLMTTFYPTFYAPSMSLIAFPSSTKEVGTILDVELSATFSRGQIIGALVGGVWNFTAQQNFRAGAIQSYDIAGVNTGVTATRTVTGAAIVLGTNTFSATANYSTGPQPKDSDNVDYDTALIAGSVSATATIQGVRALKYGSNATSSTAPTTSNAVRAFAGSQLSPVNGSTFTINIAEGDTLVCFAYPKTLHTVTSVIYVEGLGANVKDAFIESEVMVEGANGFAAVAYRVYSFVPLEPFTASATYNVTV